MNTVEPVPETTTERRTDCTLAEESAGGPRVLVAACEGICPGRSAYGPVSCEGSCSRLSHLLLTRATARRGAAVLRHGRQAALVTVTLLAALGCGRPRPAAADQAYTLTVQPPAAGKVGKPLVASLRCCRSARTRSTSSSRRR